ncbi:hypothetical protein D047_3781B, partial [Vibrio parahaemolyticus VPTS-2010_2]
RILGSDRLSLERRLQELVSAAPEPNRDPVALAHPNNRVRQEHKPQYLHR